jgi:hypothetical protein
VGTGHNQALGASPASGRLFGAICCPISLPKSQEHRGANRKSKATEHSIVLHAADACSHIAARPLRAARCWLSDSGPLGPSTWGPPRSTDGDPQVGAGTSLPATSCGRVLKISTAILLAVFLNRRSRGLPARFFYASTGPDRDTQDETDIGALWAAVIYLGV